MVVAFGLDHGELGRIEFEVALDQRERALADRAEANDDDGAVDAAVGSVLGVVFDDEVRLHLTG
jgi:hypothetical protein